jgi:hypothetical protein
MSQCPTRLGNVSTVQARYNHLPTLVLAIGARAPLCLLRGSTDEVLPVLLLRSGHLLEDADVPLSGGLDHYEAGLCRHSNQALSGLMAPDPSLFPLFELSWPHFVYKCCCALRIVQILRSPYGRTGARILRPWRRAAEGGGTIYVYVGVVPFNFALLSALHSQHSSNRCSLSVLT